MDEHVHQLFLYDNIYIWPLRVNDFVKNTLIEKWWQEGGMEDSKFPVVHASDVFRLLTLWLYGGTYMDLDVVVLKSLSGLSNFIGAESRRYLANGIMNFKSTGFGHYLADEILVELMDTFNGTTWGYNGPELVTRVLTRRCRVNKVEEMTREKCRGFDILKPHVFYPIPWAWWQLYFYPVDPVTKFPLSLIRDTTLAVHVWNKYSAAVPLEVGTTMAYGQIAQEHCPKVYAHCGKIF